MTSDLLLIIIVYRDDYQHEAIFKVLPPVILCFCDLHCIEIDFGLCFVLYLFKIKAYVGVRVYR